MNLALDLWMIAAKSAWSSTLVNSTSEIVDNLVTTRDIETKLIEAYLQSPTFIANAQLDRCWSNVAEAFSNYIEWDKSDSRANVYRLVYYISCGLAGLFTIYKFRITDEDSVIAAMIAALWASCNAENREWLSSLTSALDEWPMCFCHFSRNAFPKGCSL